MFVTIAAVEMRAGGPILIEGVAGDFERGVRRVASHHRRQPVGQQPRIGRRHLRRCRVDAVVIFDRAQQAGPWPDRLEDRADQPGHRRLAVGPGDRHQVELPRRMSGQRRAEFRVSASHVGDDALRNLNVGTAAVARAGCWLRARSPRRRKRYRRRVFRGSRQRAFARAFLTAIDGFGHADVRTADEAGRRQQRAETHGNA